MKQTGMIRALDRMGRVVIPKEFRKQLEMENEEDSFEIFLEEDHLVLKKYRPHCLFCGGTADCTAFHGQTVCRDCIRELREIETETPPEPFAGEEPENGIEKENA